MSNREDLLTAAIACLRTKGYARTTARDVATAAKTSLAAIGYHYGGLRQLLNEAAFSAIEKWGDQVQETLRAEEKTGQTYVERFTEVWARIIESVTTDREIWAASSLDLFSQVDHVPEIHEMVRRGMHGARTGNVAMFDAVDESTVDSRQEKTTGAIYYALMVGVVVQWLVDPETAPTPDDLAAGLIAVTSQVSAPASAD